MQFNQFLDYPFTSLFPVALLPPSSKHMGACFIRPSVPLSRSYRLTYPQLSTLTLTRTHSIWCRIMNLHVQTLAVTTCKAASLVILPICLHNSAKPCNYTRPDTNISNSQLQLVQSLHKIRHLTLQQECCFFLKAFILKTVQTLPQVSFCLRSVDKKAASASSIVTL